MGARGAPATTATNVPARQRSLTVRTVIALIQRVARAHVAVDGRIVAAIEAGVLAFIGVRRGDDERNAERLLERVLSYRVFPDETGRMNRSVREIEGGVLLVPQFTLAADTDKGTRAGFSAAAEPATAERLYEHLAALARVRHARVASGTFAAHMRVELVNDGPVTFWLEG
jgi:D-tyrosyl-tRNA(Tyr) deacylase